MGWRVGAAEAAYPCHPLFPSSCPSLFFPLFMAALLFFYCFCAFLVCLCFFGVVFLLAAGGGGTGEGGERGLAPFPSNILFLCASALVVGGGVSVSGGVVTAPLLPCLFLRPPPRLQAGAVSSRGVWGYGPPPPPLCPFQVRSDSGGHGRVVHGRRQGRPPPPPARQNHTRRSCRPSTRWHRPPHRHHLAAPWLPPTDNSQSPAGAAEERQASPTPTATPG